MPANKPVKGELELNFAMRTYTYFLEEDASSNIA